MVMEMAVEIDGDGSGGTSPSRQGAGTETFCPPISPSVAAVLWNFSWLSPRLFRVSESGASDDSLVAPENLVLDVES